MKIKEIENSIVSEVKKALKKPDLNVVLEHPSNPKFGDFAVCLFPFVKETGKSPQDIGDVLIKELQSLDFIEKATVLFPYLNIEIKKDFFIKSAINEAGTIRKSEKKEKVLIEYIAPNTNKPLHLGHLRNGFFGTAVSNIFKATGKKVVRVNLVNDRGEHICKSMLAYKKWGEGKTPNEEGIKGDHFVGNFYVKYSNEEKKNPLLKEEVHKMLVLWEQGDKETISLWKKMNSWVYDGFKKTYNDFGFEFDFVYYESKLYNIGKEIVKKAAEKGVFYYGEEGDILFDLPEEKFGLDKNGKRRKITLLRKDKTNLYVTQDIGVAVKKMEDHNFDKSIYITSMEQVYHFQCLFEILKVLKYKWVEKLYHLPYAMVFLPEGKMKSREGKVVDADNLLYEVKENAKKEIILRYGKIKDLEERALKIALGAIKFQLLFIHPCQDIYFDPEKSVSFEGATGPYCQYSYARAKSIIRKSGRKKIKKNVNFSVLKEEEEIVLVRKIICFDREIKIAMETFNPSKIANYLYELSKDLNRFYAKHSVLNSDKETEEARIALIFAVSLVLEKGFGILGIPLLEEM
ncbi:MAG: arginine--tRNA ligase [Candidatus Pacebacteria bacterium]|nr:arginine--tRNA ligase [Candidatus Paceibacterota bacterium]